MIARILRLLNERKARKPVLLLTDVTREGRKVIASEVASERARKAHARRSAPDRARFLEVAASLKVQRAKG